MNSQITLFQGVTVNVYSQLTIKITQSIFQTSALHDSAHPAAKKA